MAKAGTAHFTCPNCGALYHVVVKAEAGPEITNNPEVACHICSAPVPAREGQLILKYFLLRTAIHRQIWKRNQPRAAADNA